MPKEHAMFPFLRSRRSFRAVLVAALLTSSAVCGWAQDDTSPTNIPQATITIYRKGGGARAHPLVFATGTSPTELDAESYVQFHVPSVPTVVLSTQPFQGHLSASFPAPTGAWTRFLGCSEIDWQKWTSADPDNLETCYQNLEEALEGCGTRLPEGMDSPIPAPKSMPGSCQQELDGSVNPYRILRMVHLGTSQVFDAQPGQSYFFRWSFRGNEQDTVLEQVDEKTARKEMKRLHAAGQP
jgi:hypothetical protein